MEPSTRRSRDSGVCGEGGGLQLKRHDSIKQLVLEQERNDTGEEEDEKKS